MTSTGMYSVPIKDRPRPTFRQQLGLGFFYGSFLLAIVSVHAFQLAVVPLRFVLPRRTFRTLITWTKDTFGSVLVWIVEWFGPSQLVVTVGQGVDLNDVCVTGKDGSVEKFHFDRQSVWIANHQAYTDWIYAWIVFFMADVGSGIIIILKASLQWAPIVGPAMQLFQFIFLDKQKTLQDSGMLQAAQDAIAWDKPFQLLLFPEGTLVSRLTRPKSAAFAEKSGIADLENMLLPRSTGLQYCLRTLSLAMPNLSLYDITIGYEGVPMAGYAQDYFTLRTIFGLRTPPPRVHLHLRKYDLRDVPIGRVRRDATKEELERELTEPERVEFQEWVRARWREKDELMHRFCTEGGFGGVDGSDKVDSRVVRVRMRAKDWFMMVVFPFGWFVLFRLVVWARSG